MYAVPGTPPELRVVTCRNGKKLTAGKRVAGHRLAMAVIGQIEHAMGRQLPRLDG